MSNRFRGRTAVITGASAGVGEACARRFAAEGARLVLAARTEAKLQTLADELDAEVLPVEADVSKPGQCRLLIEKAIEAYGGIDVLVNNAGCNYRGPVESHTDAELMQIVDTNLRAPIVLTRLVLPHMRSAGGGAIVNVASIAGQIPVTDEATYSATKFGLRAFTYALADELRDANITVSAVSPGPIDTGFIMDDLDHVPDLVFAQPMSTADEIAGLVVECAADGRVERSRPWSTHAIATLGYLFPRLPRALAPIMAKRGQKAKARYRQRHGLTQNR